jgi:glutathione S-transferase
LHSDFYDSLLRREDGSPIGIKRTRYRGLQRLPNGAAGSYSALMAGILDNVTSLAASVARLGRGIYPVITAKDRPDPKKLLELYDFEACPYCRRVREVLSELDLDYLCHPVPRGSTRREELRKRGGKVQAPFLIDPNTETELYESDEIIAYLNKQYGAGKQAGWRIPVPSIVDVAGAAIASAVRTGHGRVTTSKRSKKLKPIEIYNFEGSPFCRKAREALCELDLVNIVRNVPKGSPKRTKLEKLGGKVMVPYMIDPNTDKAMYESDDIVAYLYEQYGRA